MEGKLITVVMPVYNAERFLSEAIDSVLSQTHDNLELLLIDDCSKDNSPMIAKEYEAKDKRVKVIVSEKNQGVAISRNIGIRRANGKYIALLDSDDIWEKDKLEMQLKLLEEEQAEIAYSSYDFIDESGVHILKPFIVPKRTNFEQMLYANDIGCSTVMIEASFFKQHLFKPDFYHEDYALWMEMLQTEAKAVGLENVYVHYRKVTGSRSDNKWNAAKQRWIIFRDELRLPVWKRVWAFCNYTINGVKKHYLKG